jgi:DNA-binding beta-propeller fold protein YncE
MTDVRRESLEGEETSPSKRETAPLSSDERALAVAGVAGDAATHDTELVGEIVVAASDGARRVPFSVVVAPSSQLLVFSFLKDEPGSVIDRFDLDGRFVGTLARFASGDGAGQLRGPAGLALDSAGNLFIPDWQRNRVVKLDAGGRFVAEWGGEGSGESELQGPRDVEIGDDGRVLVADTENHRVQIWDARGAFVASFGAEASEDDESRFLPSGRGDGEFSRPFGVTFDAEGRVWVADTNNHRVQRLSVERGFEMAFGKEGEAAGALKFPIDVRIDARGGVVVADLGGRRIQWFSPSGAIERAIVPMEAMPEGAAVADVDVDDDGNVLVPVGPLGRVFRVRAGAKRA